MKLSFYATIPVLTGYIFLGMGFGILLGAKGYGVTWAFFMPLFMYAGAMQYVAVELLASQASLLVVALTTLLVNGRHLFYGISLLDKYKGMGKKKLYMMFALTDETYSLVCRDTGMNEKEEKIYYFYISLFNQVYWIIGCILGNIVGEILPFNTKGIDFVLTALFVIIFTEQWLTTKRREPALIGVIVTIICLMVFGAKNFLIPSMMIILLILTLMRKSLEGGE